MTITYAWRGDVGNDALNALHTEGFGGPVARIDRRGRLERHSLGWVCARDGGVLVGFVNVAWGGGVHAFVLDTVVAERCRGGGVGTSLVRLAAERSRAAGCQWLHVDFEERLRAFYVDAGGFRTTAAGLIAL